MTWDNIIRTVCAVVGAAVGFLWGQLTGLFWALVAVMIIDYITGVLTAILNKRLSSAIGFKGIVKKVFILLLAGVGHILDTYVIGQGAALMTAVHLFFIANEGISILENASALGLPVPRKLKEVLEQLREDSEKGDDSK